ncbi:MAG: MotA/TolQ/ExbB proton channel family protein [Candidatus Cloacimonetes bacterium]|nr:MotA/TolQ/ExbB proton channel family protein [Candidatus Cloacimonadota bacterium]
MKFTTIFGIIIGFGTISLIFYFQGGSKYFLNWTALAITLGGTFSATITYFSWNALRSAFLSFMNIFIKKQYYPRDVVNIIVELCKEARTAGHNSLIDTESVNKIAFLKKGLTLVVDGVKPEQVENILRRENHSISERNRIGEKVFRIAGTFAPMFGLMGTVIGLIIMLNRISVPEEIPGAMGIALVTTLYGLILAALVFKPISGKIRDKNQIDTQVREIIIEGVLSIQKGENSQIAKEKLLTYLY